MASQHILIVDDQKEISSMLRSGLETLEHDLEITELLSGEEAILEINERPVDLLVSDIMLPGMTGLELMDKLKSKNPDLKVILVSGVTDKKIRRNVAEAGADAFFYKPIEMADFLDGVERTLGMVETMLPSELEVEITDANLEKEETISLSERITGLRQQLEAYCVYLMNDLGQVLVRAGELSDHQIETKLLADLMAVTLPTNRISGFLGSSSSKISSYFHGKKLNLIISPVGQTYALLMAMGKSPSVNIEEITSAMSAAVKDIFSTLSILGLLSSPGTTGQLKKSNTGNLIDPELEAMFDKAKGKKIKKEDVEEFWESLPDTQMFENIAGGEGLSFKEATKLGIGSTTNEK